MTTSLRFFCRRISVTKSRLLLLLLRGWGSSLGLLQAGSRDPEQILKVDRNIRKANFIITLILNTTFADNCC